MTVRYSQGDR